MPAQDRSLLSGIRVPEPDAMVVAGGGKGLAVRRRCDRPGFLRVMSAQDDGTTGRSQMPESELAVRRTEGQRSVVAREGNGSQIVERLEAESGRHEARRQVDDLEPVVIMLVPNGKPAAVVAESSGEFKVSESNDDVGREWFAHGVWNQFSRQSVSRRDLGWR